jgi:hypothetical protein
MCRCGKYYITVTTNSSSPSFRKNKEGQSGLTIVGKAMKKFWQALPNIFPYIKLKNCEIGTYSISGIIVINFSHRQFLLDQKIEAITKKRHYGARPGNSLSYIIEQFKNISKDWCRKNSYHDFAWREDYIEQVLE